MRIVVDPDLCTASGMCALIAPAVFELPSGATMVNVTIEETDDAELIRLAQEAANACPTGAITVEPD
jgi:ferredoxin